MIFFYFRQATTKLDSFYHSHSQSTIQQYLLTKHLESKTSYNYVDTNARSTFDLCSTNIDYMLNEGLRRRKEKILKIKYLTEEFEVFRVILL